MLPLLNDAKDVARVLWRGRWIVVGVAWGMSLLFAIGILFVRDRYEASARIYIDTQSVLKPLMAGLTFQPDVDQQVKMLAQTLITRPNLERLRASPEIGWETMDRKSYDREVDALVSKIKVESSGATNLYTISYRDTDATRARRLVESLVKTFVSSGSVDKRKDSAEALRFIDEQIAIHEQKLASAENALKEFKVKNFSVSGVPAQDFFLRMSTLSDDVNKLRLELSAAEQSRDALKRELAAEEPQLPPEALATVQSPAALTETESRLEIQKKQLDELLRRFTDEHPDVVSTRRIIAQLEAQKRREQEARAQASGAKGRGPAPTNPVFQKIRFALAEAEANVASLRVRLAAQQSRLDQVRAVASRAPEVEAELSQLNRDYEVIRKNYELLVSRRESAAMGERIDESSPLVDFRIVDPPRAVPVFPSRVVVALLGALVAIAAGLGAAFALGKLRPLVVSVEQLKVLSGRQVLGSVSLKADTITQQRARQSLIYLSAAAAALLVFQAIWVGWIVRYGLV
jgi:polysaccharide chain length determinant protein (PEP-CTERM system associated)